MTRSASLAYLDTSFVAPRYLAEASSDAIDGFLTSQPAGQLALSDWTVTEFASLLAKRVRMNDLDLATGRAIKEAFDQDMRESAIVFELARADLRKAAGLTLLDPDLGLRAGDALHLAVAVRTSSAICTLDRVLFRAASSLGLDTIDLGLLSIE